MEACCGDVRKPLTEYGAGRAHISTMHRLLTRPVRQVVSVLACGVAATRSAHAVHAMHALPIHARPVHALPAYAQPPLARQTVPPPQAVEAAVRALAANAGDSHDQRLATAVHRFYLARAFAPVWATDSGWTEGGRQLHAALQTAASEGLDPARYAVPPLSPPTSVDAAIAEVRLAFAALRFAEDLGWGLARPGTVRDAAYERRPFRGDSLLRSWAGAPDAGRALLAVAPGSAEYARLRESLHRLRAIERDGGWLAMSPGPTLRLGSVGLRVRELRRVLRQRGDLAPGESGDDAGADRFDDVLAAALARFQARHGLADDGVLGRRTLAALAVPAAARLGQVRLGLERTRWLPPVTGRRWITVNLADAHAFLFDDGVPVLRTRVVIGDTSHKTPLFADTLTNIVFNPAWNVPPSIAATEILPKLRRDPEYLVRNHMVREGGEIRQLPGPWNALGQIAFMFPNRFNVYMHDTPAKELFARPDRAHSHGCIRVQRPHDLAELVLAPDGWTRAQLDSAIATGRRSVVWLKAPIPVRLTYATAFLDDDGTLQFRPDVYGRDAELERIMLREDSRPLPLLRP